MASGLEMVLSVNISGTHLQSPTFVENLGKLLAAHPLIAPESLELEILETAALDDMAMAAEILLPAAASASVLPWMISAPVIPRSPTSAACRPKH